MSKIFNLFPLSIYATKLGLSAEERQAMVTSIENDASSTPAMIKGENRTWTGDVNGYAFLHERPAYEKLFGLVSENLRAYTNELGADPELFDFYFTRTWGTIQKRKEQIEYHAHMQSHLSAVYYPQVPKDSGMLMFSVAPNHNEFLQGLILPRHVESGVLRPSPLLAQNMNINVEDDLLILFPSKIEHATQPNPTGKTRISIAADIVCVLRDPTGHEVFLPPLDRWRAF
jgi:uncharacterized protein (TIGR02466 family)